MGAGILDPISGPTATCDHRWAPPEPGWVPIQPLYAPLTAWTRPADLCRVHQTQQETRGSLAPRCHPRAPRMPDDSPANEPNARSAYRRLVRRRL